MQQAMRPKGKIPNIAIVGAGIAGLRCADVLIKSGARVTIYEARDRIGGRVRKICILSRGIHQLTISGTSSSIRRSFDGYVSCQPLPQESS